MGHQGRKDRSCCVNLSTVLHASMMVRPDGLARISSLCTEWSPSFDSQMSDFGPIYLPSFSTQLFGSDRRIFSPRWNPSYLPIHFVFVPRSPAAVHDNPSPSSAPVVGCFFFQFPTDVQRIPPPLIACPIVLRPICCSVAPPTNPAHNRIWAPPFSARPQARLLTP